MADEAHHEIVIIKRHRGDHDDHHGGAWKIAFADFMTAMMAFFLVMWLVSANDKTRASVARYFNPVRLVDATTQPRGLHDTKKDDSGITSTPDTKEPAPKETPKAGGQPKPLTTDRHPETPSGRDKRLDAALRESPYVALAEIAGVKGPGEIAHAETSPSNPPVIGRRGGEAFRDPFAPPQHQTQIDDSSGDEPATHTVAAADGLAGDPNPTKVKKDSNDAEADQAAKLAAQRDETRAQIMAASAGAGPKIDVRQTKEGLVVSLTDTADFSMFTNGSAVPSRRVVLLMDHVAQILKDKPGQIVVRGYTDNKPFHSARYDNWHLSLDRAQVTHYMLVRGGLSDDRIGHIEGFADRVSKPGVDPASPLNRRIEILLKDDAG